LVCCRYWTDLGRGLLVGARRVEDLEAFHPLDRNKVRHFETEVSDLDSSSMV
jgi:hypothetical protein